MPVDQAVIAAAVLIQDQVLTHQPHRLGRLLIHFGDRGKRSPVTPQQVAHQRAGADLHQGLVLLWLQHGFTASARMPNHHRYWPACDRQARNPPARTVAVPGPSLRPRPPSSTTPRWPSTAVLWAARSTPRRPFAPVL